MLRITRWEKNCFPANISWWIRNLKERDTKYSITHCKTSTKQSWTRTLIIFSTILKCAAKVNLTFGFILKNRKDGGFRYFYALKNNTLLDRSKLVRTRDDLGKLKDFLNKNDVIESCSRERMNTKWRWRFYKLTNLTVLAALLKHVPMGYKNAVIPESLLRNGTINCLTYEENTRRPYYDKLCLFSELALHLHGIQRLEEKTSKLLNLFINKLDGLSADQFEGIHMNDIPFVEDLLTLNIVLYDIDIVDGNIIGEVAGRCLQKKQQYCLTVVVQ